MDIEKMAVYDDLRVEGGEVYGNMEHWIDVI